MVYTRLKYTIYDVYEIWVYEIGFTVIGRYTELKVYEMSRHQRRYDEWVRQDKKVKIDYKYSSHSIQNQDNGWNLNSLESYMNLITLPGNLRHHIGKLKVLAYLLFEAFMRAYIDDIMKLLYPLCLVRLIRRAESAFIWRRLCVFFCLSCFETYDAFDSYNIYG